MDVQRCIRAMRMLAHRGPDGEGYITGSIRAGWAKRLVETGDVPDWPPDLFLGHTRLAIIDLTSAASQPMCNEDGAVWVCFNGEIYNHMELRKELTAKGHAFRTLHSDTEVLVHGYEQWGLELIDRLRGMFGLAILDLKARKLLLVRDPFGEKPLYVGITARGIAFSSEINAIAAVGLISPSLNEYGVANYLRSGYIPAPATIYTGIKKLCAAEVCVVDLDSEPTAHFWQYWDLNDHEPTNVAENTWLEEFDHRIRTTVQSRLISDVPVGAFLSGGVDSSYVLRQMAAITPAVAVFTAGFPGERCDETENASAVAARYGAEHHVINVSPRSLIDDIPAAAAAYDEPFADSSALPLMKLCKFAKTRVGVVLSGDGGDELLGGYSRYRINVLLDTVFGDFSGLPGRVVSSVASKWSHKMKGFGIARLLNGPAATRYEAMLADPWLVSKSAVRSLVDDRFTKAWDASLSCLMHQMCKTDIRVYVPDNLMVKIDRVSMRYGLEVRAPFLDRDLFEFVVRCPAALTENGRFSRARVRATLEADLRHAELKKKRGFVVPLGAWLKTDLYDVVHDSLMEANGLVRQLFEVETLAKLLQDHLTGTRDQSHWLWTLFMLSQWDRCQYARVRA